MPKRPKLDSQALWEKLRLTLRQRPHGGGELREALGVSQPTLSLLIKDHKQELFITGKTKSAKYALPRETSGLPNPIQVYAINTDGRGSKAGTLSAVHPGDSFHWEGQGKERSGFYPGLPYFLEDLRPGGYLGALIPRLHPELEGPQDITRWNTDQCLRYLTQFGSDLIGNHILGDTAYSRFLDRNEAGVSSRNGDLAAVYEKAASDVLAMGDAGSSAAGEQPKFLFTKERGAKVIVKFSPRREDARAHRQADLLRCEWMALEPLRRLGIEVEAGEIIEGSKRTFLEVGRFDRVGERGRRGMVSLRALDLELVGKGEGWGGVAEALFEQKKISAGDLEKVQLLDLYGALIANSDRHLGNLSFFVEPGGELRLAPVYDMLPMLYFPKVEVVPRLFSPPSPVPSQAKAWRVALPAAMEFWGAVGAHKAITAEFRSIARENHEILAGLERKVAALPS